MAVFNVSNNGEFMTALGRAVGGDKIILADGNYGSVWIGSKNPNATITIQAATAGTSVHFDDLTVRNSSNLSFSGFDVGRPLSAGQPEWTPLTLVRDGSNIKFDGMTFHGSIDDDPSNDGIGLQVTNVAGFSVSNSHFTELYRGITTQTSTNITIANNDMRTIRSDGVISAGNDGIVIDGNLFSDFKPILGDHADAIQFFNVGLTKGQTNITVKNNVLIQNYFSGVDQTGVQGIWITDGGDYGYKNVLVQNNLIYSNNMYNGITVNQAQGVQIIGNTVLSDPTDSKMLWIRLEGDVGVSLQNNVTENILSTNVTDFFQSGNVNLMIDPGQRAKIANLLHPTSVNDLLFPGAGYQIPSNSTSAPVSSALGSGIGDLISGNHSASTVASIETAMPGGMNTAPTFTNSAAEAKMAMSMNHFGWHFDHFTALP